MRKHLPAIYVAVLATLGLLDLVLLFHASHGLDTLLFNSDAMYLPTLFADVLAGNGAIDHWYLTPAPYFFPDYPLFLLAYLATPVPFLQISLYALLQSLLTLLLLLWMARRMRIQAAGRVALLLWLCLLWLAYQKVEPFVFLLVSGYHFGGLMSAMALMALWFVHLQAGAPWRSPAWWLACVLAAMTTLSDQLFLVQAAAPLVAVAWLLALGIGTHGRRIAVQAALIGVSSVAGSLAYRLLVAHPMRDNIHLGPCKWQENLQTFIDLLVNLVVQQPLYLITLVALVCLLLQTLLRFRRPGSLRACDESDWLLLFVPFSFLATLLAGMLSESHSLSYRYLIGIGVWPLLASGLVLACRLPRALPPLATLLSTLLVLLLSLQAYEQVQLNGLRTRQYPADIACIDQALEGTGVHNGIAEYWDAKHVQNLSRHRLRIAQFFETLEEMRWITTADAYVPRYDFAIVSQTPDGVMSPLLVRVQDINESPLRQVLCGKRLLLVYGPNRLRTVARFQLPGDRQRWRGCDLPSRIGQPDQECELGKRDPSLQGVLSFGPYVTLPAGSYRATVRYHGQGAEGTRIGHWDVAVTKGKNFQILAEEPLLAQGLDQAEASKDFVIDTTQSAGLVEVRTFSETPTALHIMAVEIERLR